MANGWFNPFNSEWFNSWFGSESGEIVAASVTFDGSSTFTCSAIAQSITPPTPLPTGEMIGGYRRRRLQSHYPKYTKRKVAQFSWLNESNFEITAHNQIATELDWKSYSIFHVGVTLHFSSSVIIQASSYSSITAITSKRAQGKTSKSKLGIGAQAIEIDLLEEEELLLLLAL